MIKVEDDGGFFEDVVFFDFFGRNWVENDSYWDDGFVFIFIKSSIWIEEWDRVERKKGRKNIDVKFCCVVGEEKEDIGLIKEGLLKGFVYGEGVFKELDNEFVL